jgi:alpha-L-fucosidase
MYFPKALLVKRIFFTGLFSLLLFTGMQAQQSKTGGDRVRWFREAKFGMFIHWGLYAEAAGHWDGKNYYGIGEWLMKRAKIKTQEYEKLAGQFNPEKFNAEEWVKVAKDAGMKYIVITAKHHDGFAMFKSEASKYNIVDATPFKRDPLKELAEACRKAGIRLGFYYSQYQDWHEPGAGGNTWEFAGTEDQFNEYFEKKCKPQVKELLTNYGQLGLIWFDTPGKMTKEQSMELVDLVRKYQPGCLVSSRVGNNVGDYLDFGDGEIPAQKVDKAWEALFTHNDSWGYVDVDHNWKSTEEIVRMLSEINGKGGNFLLNVGPKSDGTLPQETVEVFRRTGKWIDKNRDAVYATSYSPFPELPWGTCTSKPGELFLHVHQWPQVPVLRIPGIRTDIKSVNLLESGVSLTYERQGNDLLIHLPCHIPDPFNSVIRLTYKGELSVDSLQHLSPDFSNRLLTAHASRTGQTSTKLYNFAEEFGDWKHAEVLENWTNETDQASWDFCVDKAGEYRIALNYSFPLDIPKREGVIEVAGQKMQFETLQTGTRVQDFYQHVIGMILFPAPGKYTFVIKPVGQGTQFIKLREVCISNFD